MKYPITCMVCEDYLGEYENVEQIKSEGHIILEDTGCVSEAGVQCKRCAK